MKERFGGGEEICGHSSLFRRRPVAMLDENKENKNWRELLLLVS